MKNKNILISDFDGTLFVNDREILENAKMIREFRSKGNIFIISTARNYGSIKDVCNKYNIEVDYFFCDLGSVILENDGNVLYKKYISQDDRKNIEIIILNYENKALIKRYGTISKQDKDAQNVIEYKIESDYETLEEIKKQLDKVIKSAKTQITEDNRLIIHTSTKKQIIDIFINNNKVDVNSIFTIGDELDDLEMLIKYNGYRMNKSNKKLQENNIGCVNSVSELIKKIMK